MVCVLAVSARLPPNQNVLLLKKLGIRAAPQSFDYLLIKRVSNHKRPQFLKVSRWVALDTRAIAVPE